MRHPHVILLSRYASSDERTQLYQLYSRCLVSFVLVGAILWFVLMGTTIAQDATAKNAAIKEAPARSALKAPSDSTVHQESIPGLRVFTCGHSFHVWVVPILSELAKNAGIDEHRVAGVSSIGGSTVLKHWDVPDEKNKAKEALRAGSVDVLTLSPIWLPDEGIDKFAALAVEANPKIRITVQQFWLPNDEYHPVYPLETRKKVDHNATSMASLRKAQDAYDHDVDEYLRALNKKLGYDALISVPVGQAVVALREKIIAGEAPGVTMQSELFRDNWGHPTQLVQALAAYCHFAIIYQRTPVGLPRPTILARNSAWDDKLNHLLQELAWDAVKTKVKR
jgi:hypothetical protein